MKDAGVKRRIYKTITWRIIATILTFIIAWIVTGDPRSGAAISLLDFASKTLTYYWHESVWDKFQFNQSLK